MRKDAKGVEVPELLAEADVVSLHCPLTPAIDELINRAWRGVLSAEPPHAYGTEEADGYSR